jgi:hypothetical protein
MLFEVWGRPGLGYLQGTVPSPIARCDGRDEEVPMDTTAITTEILEIRDRLGDIEEIRKTLREDDFARRAELLDEEHELEARLAELRGEAAKAGAGLAEKHAASAADTTRTPDLPES